MPPFSRLIRFESDEKIYFSDLGANNIQLPSSGSYITAYPSLDDLNAGKNDTMVAVGKVDVFCLL